MRRRLCYAVTAQEEGTNQSQDALDGPVAGGEDVGSLCLDEHRAERPACIRHFLEEKYPFC